MNCAHCSGAGRFEIEGWSIQCRVCEGVGAIHCGDCQRGVFRAEPCASCFDEVNKRLTEVTQ